MAKQVFLVGTLLLLVIAGVCSSVLVATDWNGLTSDESLAGLGVLLFFVGAGIGSLAVLVMYWGWSVYKTRRNKAAAAAAAADADAAADMEKLSKKAQDEINIATDAPYNIHVHRVQIAETFDGAKISDAALLNKLGLGVKQVMHKVSSKMLGWSFGSGKEIATATPKAMEKQNVDTLAAPTPRIYVLPPDEFDGVSATQTVQTVRHSRSRSEIPALGKVGKPDVTILDIKPSLKKPEEEAEESDCEESCDASDSNSQMDVSEAEKLEHAPAELIELPDVQTIDTQLGAFVQSLDDPATTSTYMLSVMIEEVLPRPDSGLLKRMLRMSEIPVGRVEGSGEPILHLRVGSECHVSIGLIKVNEAATPLEISGPHRITFKPLDGEEVDLNATYEAVDTIEHVTSAFWDLKSHASHALTRASSGDSASAVLTPIEMTLVFQVHYSEEGDLIREVEVKKTFMASMRRELASLDVDQRFTYEDAVVDFVLSKMELISMPSLLMFLQVDSAIPR